MNPENTDSDRDTSKSSSRIAQSIRREILTGRLLPEDPLPPERDLARRFCVHRGAVREAMSILQQARLIKSTPRGRTRVRNIWKEGGLEMLQCLFDPECLPSAPAGLLDEVMSLRRICYASLAAYAAVNATDEDRNRIESMAMEFPDPTEDPRDFLSRDLLFLEALADASGTTILRWLFNTTRPAIEQISPLLAPFVSERSDKKFYLDLARAVSRRDEEAAKKITSRHCGIRDLGLGESTMIDKAASRTSDTVSKERPPSSMGEKSEPKRPKEPEESKVPHTPLNHFVWMKTSTDSSSD